MSLLPQRKKSAEEIANLRETLGVPAPPEGEVETPATTEFETLVPTHHEAIVEHHPASPEPEPPAALPHPKPVQGDVPHLPKPVRSLRKSEQVPILLSAPPQPSADSQIPVHRHSDEEIAQIRRREALAMMTPSPPNPKLAAAHVALLIPGYLLSLAGASCFFFYQFPMVGTAGCAAAAWLIATFVFVRRPLSRHHAAFISVITLVVLVFATLHFFPQLRHAT